MSVEIRCVSGAQVQPWLPALAQLRISVFRDWPYLYDGDLDYEADYLASYAQSASSVFVLALDQKNDSSPVVGAATGIALIDDAQTFQQPFIERGIATASVYYFGESVLLPAYRGRGIGHQFFDYRQAHAKRLGGFMMTAFCAVDRAIDDPRRPASYRSNDTFWQKRGYSKQPGMQCRLSWKEIDQAQATEKTLTFWLRSQA